jgi:small multidrug resistance family-3 protein
MTSVLYYLGAALAEIAGCFAFWAWLRLGKSPFWSQAWQAYTKLHFKK